MERLRRCRQPCALIHDRRLRKIRDSDLFDQHVLLLIPVRRVECLACGRVTEHIPWLAPVSRLTQQGRNLAAAPADQPYRPIHRPALAHNQGPCPAPPAGAGRGLRSGRCSVFGDGRVRFAQRPSLRHDRYGCRTQTGLWVGKGNSSEALRPFFERLGARRQQIEAVAMDMNTGRGREGSYLPPPRSDPYVRDYRIRLLPRVHDEAAYRQAPCLPPSV